MLIIFRLILSIFSCIFYSSPSIIQPIIFIQSLLDELHRVPVNIYSFLCSFYRFPFCKIQASYYQHLIVKDSIEAVEFILLIILLQILIRLPSLIGLCTSYFDLCSFILILDSYLLNLIPMISNLKALLMFLNPVFYLLSLFTQATFLNHQLLIFISLFLKTNCSTTMIKITQKCLLLIRLALQQLTLLRYYLISQLCFLHKELQELKL